MAHLAIAVAVIVCLEKGGDQPTTFGKLAIRPLYPPPVTFWIRCNDLAFTNVLAFTQVIGPFIDSIDLLFGDYSPTVMVTTKPTLQAP